MFRNLNTEKNYSNHFLINTKFTKIYDFEEDNLEIIKLHDTLKNTYLEGYNLPLIEFKYKTNQWSNQFPTLELSAIVVYKSDTLVIKDLNQSQFNDSKWFYKYVNFRKIQTNGETGCFWYKNKPQ